MRIVNYKKIRNFITSIWDRFLCIYLFVFLMGWGCLFVLSLLSGTLLNNTSKKFTPFYNDILFHIFWIIIIPVGVIILLDCFKNLSSLKDKIDIKYNISIRDIPFKKYFLRSFIIAGFGSLAFLLLNYANTEHSVWWNYNISGIFVNMYIIFISTLVIALTMAILSYAIQLAKNIDDQLFSSIILPIDIYHPDGCGGIKWISKPFISLLKFSIPCYLLGLVIIVNLVVVQHQTWLNPIIIWNLIWPSVFGPFVAFVVIRNSGVTKYLSKEKENRLKIISKKISEVNMKISRDNKGVSINTINNIEYINKLITYYKNIEKDFSIWPLSKKKVTMLFATGPAVSIMYSSVKIIVDIFSFAVNRT